MRMETACLKVTNEKKKILCILEVSQISPLHSLPLIFRSFENHFITMKFSRIDNQRRYNKREKITIISD